MADVLLLLVALIVVVAGGFAVYFTRVAAGRQEKVRLRAARRAALADQEASEEYIHRVNSASTVEELERLAEERDLLWACSYSLSSSASSG